MRAADATSRRTSSRIGGLTAAVAAAALLLTGCGSGGSDGAGRIVVTTNILGDVVQELVGDQVEVMTLMPPDADPHSFEVSAQEAARIGTADLLISNGLGLEEGVQHLVDAAESDGVPVSVAGDSIDTLPAGDAEGAGPDPHFWTDPARMSTVVDSLATAILEHVPGMDEGELNESVAAYKDELDALDAELEADFAAIPAERRSLVTDHHVFGYLAERYDFEVVGAVIPSGTTLAAPSAADLADLASTIREAGVPAIFVQSTQPARLAEVLAQEAGVEVQIVGLFSESLSAAEPGAATYLEMMRTNADRLVEALG